MTTKFRPLNNYIQVMPDAPEKQVRGIIMAPSAQVLPNRGLVIAVGPGKDGVVMPDVKPGDFVMFTAGSLLAVKSADGVIFLIEAQTILGVDTE